MNSEDDAALNLGEVAFYDNYLPSLSFGEYRITVQHQVGVDGAVIPDHVRRVAVTGPRFSLAPQDIHQVYPPDQSSGHFSRDLPQVVLARRMLPWERTIHTVSGDAPPPPWLALLVLEGGEIAGRSKPAGITVAELLAPDPAVAKPDLIVTEAEQGTTCHTVDVAATTFLAIAPTLAELPYLAHCRQSHVGDKAKTDAAEEGWFSVVVANRFPRAPTTDEPNGVEHSVHLVSLEGWSRVLDGTQPLAPTKTHVRLVSLASWTFRCQPDMAETFAGVTGGLAEHAAALRLDAAVADAALAERLAGGYVPVPWLSVDGEQALAWYRGPLVPVAETARPAVVQAAGQPSIYVVSDGMFDHSYAAAWQLGRLLGLADHGLVDALSALLAGGRQVIDRLLATRRLGLALPKTLDELMGANPAVDQMARQFDGGLIAHVAAAANQPAAPARGPARIPAPANHVQATRDLFADAEAKALLAERARRDLPPIIQWLVRLSLLYGVPFDHLVPRAEMLPEESIRFFMTDPNWIGAVVNGALSLAVGTSLDRAYLDLARGSIDAGVTAQLDAMAGRSTAGRPLSGLLIRSSLMAGWPGVAVRASGGGVPLPTLRMELLAGSVLIALFSGAVDTVALCEPQHALRYGLDEAGLVVLRRLQGPDTGAPIPSARDPNVAMTVTIDSQDFRPASRVLDVGRLRTKLATAVEQPDLRPAELALLMLAAPEQVVFKRV